MTTTLRQQARGTRPLSLSKYAMLRQAGLTDDDWERADFLRSFNQTLLDSAEQCAACPWRDGEPASRQLTVDGPGGRKFLVHASPLAAPDGSGAITGRSTPTAARR